MSGRPGSGSRASEAARRPRAGWTPIAGGAALFLAAIALAVSSLHKAQTIWTVGARLEYARAAWGVVEESIEAKGLIIRDERVLVSPVTGTVRFMASEGEKVRAGAVVAEVADDEARQRVEPPLLKAREELDAFEAYASARLDALEQEAASLRLDVENEKRALARSKASGDARAAREAAAALASAEGALDRALARLDREVESLEAKRRQLTQAVSRREASYEHAVFRFRAQEPAVVSFELDGLEDELSPSACERLDEELASSLEPSTSRVEDGATVQAGQPVLRLVDNSRLVVAAFLPDDQASELVTKRSVRVEFEGVAGGPVTASVRRSDDGTSPAGRRGVLLEVSGFPAELVRGRRVGMRIVKNVRSGLVIPERAVVRADDADIVYVPANLGVVRKTVEIRASDGERVVVEGLREGDRVVADPDAISRGRVAIRE